MVDIVLASTMLWNVKKNKWKWKIIQKKEARDQSKKSLPITELCHELGFIPGNTGSFVPSFPNAVVNGDHCQ